MNQSDTFTEQEAIDFLEEKRSDADAKETSFKLILLSLVAANLDILLYSGDNIFSRETLKDLFQGIYLVVENLDPKVEEDGLTRDQLLEEIKSTLTRAGIQVLSDDEYNQSERRPLLVVTPHILRLHFKARGMIIYVWNLYVKFSQIGFLMLEPESFLHDETITLSDYPVTTWEIGQLGCTPYLSDITEAINEATDRFINAYLSVNPQGLFQRFINKSEGGTRWDGLKAH